MADVFSKGVDREVNDLHFKPLKIGSNGTSIAKLKFADHTLFFREPEEDSLRRLMSALIRFCEDLRLKINLNKSTMLGINIEEEDLATLAAITRCILVFHWGLILVK